MKIYVKEEKTWYGWKYTKMSFWEVHKKTIYTIGSILVLTAQSVLVYFMTKGIHG